MKLFVTLIFTIAMTFDAFAAEEFEQTAKSKLSSVLSAEQRGQIDRVSPHSELPADVS